VLSSSSSSSSRSWHCAEHLPCAAPRQEQLLAHNPTTPPSQYSPSSVPLDPSPAAADTHVRAAAAAAAAAAAVPAPQLPLLLCLITSPKYSASMVAWPCLALPALPSLSCRRKCLQASSWLAMCLVCCCCPLHSHWHHSSPSSAQAALSRYIGGVGELAVCHTQPPHTLSYNRYSQQICLAVCV
jgi:hypothetical protein